MCGGGESGSCGCECVTRQAACSDETLAGHGELARTVGRKSIAAALLRMTGCAVLLVRARLRPCKHHQHPTPPEWLCIFHQFDGCQADQEQTYDRCPSISKDHVYVIVVQATCLVYGNSLDPPESLKRRRKRGHPRFQNPKRIPDGTPSECRRCVSYLFSSGQLQPRQTVGAT